MRGWAKKDRLGVTVLVVLFWVCGCSSMPGSGGAQQPGVVKVSDNSQPAAQAQAPSAPVYAVPFIPTPNSIDLCGEPVPLDRTDVYERFDKEFTLVVYNHAQVYLWLKRMERYFPTIEERLRYHGLPDDLKYVAIVESDLLPNACSPKGAAGPWQFMKTTGAAYGLEQRGSVDKRYDFERSTDSAFLLLGDLYRKYNSWALAIAAYNCGDKRILDESRYQGVRGYYDMKLPLETERYVFRILAVKAVLSNPNRYGYDLPKGLGYQELKLDRVTVSLPRPVPIQTIASSAGTTYREVKSLNPAFRSDDIPAGNHEINLPPGTGNKFKENFAAYEGPAGLKGRDDPEQELDAHTQPSQVSQPVESSRSKSTASDSKSRAKQKTKTAKAGSAKSKKKTDLAHKGSHEARQKTRSAKAGSSKAKKGANTTKIAANKAKRKNK